MAALDSAFGCPRCRKPILVEGGRTGQQVACPYCAGACLIPPAPRHGVPPPAQFHCNNPKCDAVWFEDQLLREEFEGQPVYLCPRCRLGVTRLAPPPSFWERVPLALAFPFRGDGPWLVGLGTLFLALLDLAVRYGFGIGSLFALIITIGYFGMFGLDVIRISALDEDRAMDWPDLDGWADIIAGAFQVFLSGLFVFGPALIAWFMTMRAFIWGTDTAAFGWSATAVGLTVTAFLYYPMAMLAVAMYDTSTATDPRIVLPAIVKVPLHYGFVLLLLVVLSGLRSGAQLALGALPALWQVIGFLPVEFVSFCTLIVSCRLLGILYRANEKKLGWFS